jgi:hypothetical protein
MRRSRLKPPPGPNYMLWWHLRTTLLVAAFATVAIASMVFVAQYFGKLQDLQTWSLRVFAPLALFVLWNAIDDARNTYGGGSSWSSMVGSTFALLTVTVVISILLALAGILVVGLGSWVMPAGLSAIELLRNLSSKAWLVTATTLGTLVIGIAFFVFRLFQRFLYGATEAIAGTAVAAHRISIEPGTNLPSETGFYFAVLTAGVYLIVRGLDNIHQALQGRDPFILWLSGLALRFARKHSDAMNEAPEIGANSGANPVRNERQ